MILFSNFQYNLLIIWCMQLNFSEYIIPEFRFRPGIMQLIPIYYWINKMIMNNRWMTFKEEFKKKIIRCFFML